MRALASGDRERVGERAGLVGVFPDELNLERAGRRDAVHELELRGERPELRGVLLPSRVVGPVEGRVGSAGELAVVAREHRVLRTGEHQ